MENRSMLVYVVVGTSPAQKMTANMGWTSSYVHTDVYTVEGTLIVMCCSHYNFVQAMIAGHQWPEFDHFHCRLSAQDETQF